MKKKSFISVILLVSLSGLFTVSWADTGINDNKLINTKEDIVMEYINSMKNNNYQQILQKTNLNNLGKEEYEDNLVNHNNMISVPEKKDYKNSELQLEYQHDAIEASFGENAWDHIEYETKKLDHLDGETVFYNKETGAEITRQEYYALNDAYWSSVAAKEGITIKELFSFSDCDTDINPDNAYRYYMIFLNNLNHEPTERRIREAYEAYVVNLTFNDKEKTDEMENVHFLISNEDKEWKVKEGLMWSDIIEDCADSDIAEIDH